VNSSEQEVPPEKWQALEASWKTILGLEASIESLRLSMDGLRAELEAAFKKTLAVEDKIHALQADVVQWNKAKSRIHYALPKVREFIHRAIWATGAPERKRLEEIVEHHIEPRKPLPDMDEVGVQLGHLQKDRQVLFGQGNSVYQEGKGILAEVQRALSTLQRNAADRARQKRSAGREKGKHF
jgi:chromosome segregation ATPase